MNHSPTKMEQSIRQRILNISRERKEDFQFLLIRYALERFLYRLSKSSYAESFILKGALLLTVWTDQRYRPTRDLDLLGIGDRTPQKLKTTIRKICQTYVEPDGLTFNVDGISITEIRDDQEYGGERIKFEATLGNSRIPLQIDVAFGDAVSPDVEIMEYPTLLDMSLPVIRTYPKETVVAEKLQSMVFLGMQNSRLKDFFDIFWLSNIFDFNGRLLVEAIAATFHRRRTDIPPDIPLALSEEFANDQIKQTQWIAFLKRSGVSGAPDNFPVVVEKLREFLETPLQTVKEKDAFECIWPAGGPWQKRRQSRQ